MGASASKEKFRESVALLIEKDVSPDDAEFWDELWKIASSPEDVFEMLSPESARKLRDERFDNLSTLFTQATAQLCQIVETPYNIYFDQALNCVRVLTRILPFLLEKGDLGDEDENVEQLCWGLPNEKHGEDAVKSLHSNDSGDSGKESILNDSKCMTATETSRDDNDGEDNDDDQEPLALLVIHAAMHMLFLPQFTCDFYEAYDLDDDNSIPKKPLSKKEVKENWNMRVDAGLGESRRVEGGVSLVPKPTTIIWAAGCGVVASQLGYDGSTSKYDRNRVEVLRLLLAACCDPLFSPADEYNPLSSRWLSIATAADAPNAICLFYSLMNTILSYDPNGMGVPYAGAFASDVHIRLVELSTQVLCVLLDYGLSGSPEEVLDENNSPVVDFDEASKGGFNIFRVLLARINSTKELDFCYKGFVQLLKNVYESKNTLLPNSKSKLDCFQELLVLLWKMLEENPFFMKHILTKCDVNELITPICFLMYQSRKDPVQVGLVHICTFILLKLSGDRSCGVSLNKPFTTKLPCDLPLFTGSHLDLVSITLHKLIVEGAYKLVPLYSCFLTIICNISPYWRSMSLVAAVKLVNLFELFSSPKFLYSGENAYKHLALLFEVFNNVIQYQYTGNQHLVYAIIRRKDPFGRLASLNVEEAQAQCKEVYGESNRVHYDGDAEDAKIDILESSVNGESKEASSHEDNTVSTPGGTSIGDASTNISTVTGEGFIPGEEWITAMKSSLPMETVARLLQHTVPVIDELCNRKHNVVNENDILEVLTNITMVGLLPVPHELVLRKYQPNQYTSLWFTAFMWGVIYLRNQNPPIFDAKHVELFQVSLP